MLQDMNYQQGKFKKTLTNRFNEISEKLNNLTVDYTNLTSKISELENKIIPIEKNLPFILYSTQSH